MNIMAIIPARGGSRGIPKKNIKILGEKPLIAYTIEAAKKSKYIDKVIVSTDSDEIAYISKKYGAEIPFIRPAELSKDETPGIDPILHAVDYMITHEKYIPDYVVCLQCTSPFRNHTHIDVALESVINSSEDSLVSVCESDTLSWMKKIVDNRLVNYESNEKIYARRQDAPKAYKLNGAIYAIKKDVLLENKSLVLNNRTIPFIMDNISSLDIDEPIDFEFAEFLIKTNKVVI